MKKFAEIFIALLVICLTSVFVSLLFWQVLIWAAKTVGELGVSIGLVGDPNGIDPGALIVASIFLVAWALVAMYSYKSGKRHLGHTFVVCAPLSAFFVFAQISSLAW